MSFFYSAIFSSNVNILFPSPLIRYKQLLESLNGESTNGNYINFAEALRVTSSVIQTSEPIKVKLTIICLPR